MKRIKFNNVYFGRDEDGYVNLFFENNFTEEYLFFDGINFSYKKAPHNIINKLSYLNNYQLDNNLFIEKITQELDMSFIILSNGDIFQINLFQNYNDDKINQEFQIFNKTKLSSSEFEVYNYNACLKRANETPDADILEEIV